ncbi:MAG: DUF4124 domain-containing protein [Myxococcaceae bacterium]|jgi:hypothetical protein|nr:DUF4124 domain-containing protein [Myxococcaceae bacterium]
MRPLSLPLICLASAALAQTVYSWTDDEGVVHFTDSLAQVPRSAAPSATLLPKDAKKASEADEPPLRAFDKPFWRRDVPACKKALEHAVQRRVALKEAEAKLNALKREFEPCQRYLDICWSRNLSRPTWERECRARPAACDLPVPAQEQLVQELRDEVDGLPEWLERMGQWGCVK